MSATDCFATNFGVASSDPLVSTLTWLRGAAGFTPATWTDQSFQGNNATQGTGPQQAESVSNVLGGQAIVRCVDNARIMNLPNIQPTTGSFTKLAVFKSSDLTQSNNLMSGTFTANSHVFWLNAGQFPESAVFSSETPILQLESTIGVGSPQTAWSLAMLTVFHSVNPNTEQDTWQSQWYLNGQCAGISLTFNETAPTSNTISVLWPPKPHNGGLCRRRGRIAARRRRTHCRGSERIHQHRQHSLRAQFPDFQQPSPLHRRFDQRGIPSNHFRRILGRPDRKELSCALLR